MTPPRAIVSAVIVAGGEGRRLGRDKATLYRPDGTPLLQHIAATLAVLAHEIIVVAGTGERCARLAALLQIGASVEPLHGTGEAPATVTWQPDDTRFAHHGPLAGLYSGMRVARGDVVVALACDMPYVQAALLRLMLGLLQENDIVLPIIDDRAQPLHAIYRRLPCLEAAERHLLAGQLAVRALYTDPTLRVVSVDRERARAGDPAERSWHGVNTPIDMLTAGLVYRGDGT